MNTSWAHHTVLPKTWPDRRLIRRPRRYTRMPGLGRVCRLGLSTRGDMDLDGDSVRAALARGVNYLNWPGVGYDDGVTDAVRGLGAERKRVAVATQFSARTAEEARKELREILALIGSDYIDVLTYYYVETPAEWEGIIAPGGAAEVLEDARAQGFVRRIGVTTHQRRLAARMAASGRVDMLMIRYNAAHRGAETEVFPAAAQAGIPVVTYTAQRWGALKTKTADDPAGFRPPGAPVWYRWALCHPSVAVCLMAPDGDVELAENLELLDDWRGMGLTAYNALCAHGDRVRKHGGAFP